MIGATPARLAVSWSAALVLLAGLPGTAIAQGEGVHVDPESPSGKEYALPFESARQDASPPGRGGAGLADAVTSAGAAESAPPFGVGITSRASGVDADASGGSERRAETGAEANRLPVAAAGSGGGASDGWLTALIACGVLVAGAAAGLSMRALRGRTEA